MTWWASALGAAAGRFEPGVVVGLIVVAIQIAAARHRGATIFAVLVAGVLGVMLETAVIAAGLVQYGASSPAIGLAPVWLIALWLVFGTFIEATIRMFGSRPRLWSALAAAVLAPPTYWGGMRLGALTLAEPIWLPLAIMAIVWAIATPLMVAAYQRGCRR